MRAAEPPLAAIGLVSAVANHARRSAVRDTWFRSPECVSGEIVSRFVIARPADAHAAASLDAEAVSAGDLVVLQTGVSGRVWSPLHTTFRWLQYAASTAPFLEAQYVAKMDDDVYLVVPELVGHLRQMRAVPHTSPSGNVYYGMFYWTSYTPADFMHRGSTYDMLTANRASAACIRSAACEGSFPFTTGSMQLLSRSLARTLASAPATAAHIETSRSMVNMPRRTPAFEDVWMGYALYALLPAVTNITLVGIDRYNYYFDQRTKPTMKNTTMLVHFATKTKESQLALRIHAAHNFSMRQHCASSGTLGCGSFRTPRCGSRSENASFVQFCQQRTRRYKTKYGAVCSMRPDFSVCSNHGASYPILNVGR